MFAIGDKEWPGVSKLIEEMGELAQVLGKLMGSRGNTEHWSGDLRNMLFDELADVMAALDFVVNHNLSVDETNIVIDRHLQKYKLFQKWHEEDPEK